MWVVSINATQSVCREIEGLATSSVLRQHPVAGCRQKPPWGPKIGTAAVWWERIFNQTKTVLPFVKFDVFILCGFDFQIEIDFRRLFFFFDLDIAFLDKRRAECQWII